MTISGALALIVSKAQTSVNVLDGAKLTAENGQVKLSAEDQSKLAVRAGGLSISKGTSVGVGASFALVFARNVVEAIVGKNVQVKAASFLLRAAKQRVDFSDYQSTFDLSLLLTDSTGVRTTAPRRASSTSRRATRGRGYKITINISTDTVLDAIDLLNFLSSNNYYAESIAGAISGGTGGKASVAGAVACVFFFNVTRAMIGSGTNGERYGRRGGRRRGGHHRAADRGRSFGQLFQGWRRADGCVRCQFRSGARPDGRHRHGARQLRTARREQGRVFAITIAVSVTTTGTGVAA